MKYRREENGNEVPMPLAIDTENENMVRAIPLQNGIQMGWCDPDTIGTSAGMVKTHFG